MAAIIGDERTMFNSREEGIAWSQEALEILKYELQDNAKRIEIDTASLIVEEETFVSVTRVSYIERTRPALQCVNTEEVGKRDDDELIFRRAC